MCSYYSNLIFMPLSPVFKETSNVRSVKYFYFSYCGCCNKNTSCLP